MATLITFNARRGDNPLTLSVDQSPDQVMAAHRAANGQPFPLDQQGGGRVYVQPLSIAFWRDQGGGVPMVR